MPVNKLNFIFIRHGLGCHNVISSLSRAKLIRYNDAMDFSEPNGKFPLIDPELTSEGVNKTIRNAKVLKKMLELKGINTLHAVISSPLIRAMETAFYTKREFEDESNPLPIYVSPYLREIDESSDDPKSKSSRKIIDTIPAYAMLPLENQKKYLKSEGILNHFNFDYLDPELRKEPGIIPDFLNWLDNSKLLEKYVLRTTQLNILVVTHAGVLKYDTNESFPNNAGFIKTIDSRGKAKDFILDKNKFKSLSNDPADLLNQTCPQGSQTQRCNQICKKIDQNKIDETPITPQLKKRIPPPLPPIQIKKEQTQLHEPNESMSPLLTLPPTPKSFWKRTFF